MFTIFNKKCCFLFSEGSKDTKESDLTKVTFEPKLKLFEDDIMESMNIKETRKRTKTYWY